MPSASHVTSWEIVPNVVPIGCHPRVFPRGTEVRHLELGWLLVEQASGNERLVRWYGFREVPEAEFSERFDAAGDPVVEELEITLHRKWVNIVALRRIADPDRQRPTKWQRLKALGVLRLPIEVIDRYVRPAAAPERPASGGKGGAA
jgi:hypothetical protein